MPKKIIIVGAGIAGLAACTELMNAGFEVLILEARDHAGGRAFSHEKLGIPLGTGANWIHGNDKNPIALLANQFHANMVPVDREKFVTFDQHGHPVSHQMMKEFNIKFDRYLAEAKKSAGQSDDISLKDALAPIMNRESFSSAEFALFQSKLKFFEGYIGDNYEFLSAKHWDHETPWPGDNCFLISSYQPIITGLSKNCRIKLNTLVTSVSIKKTFVEVMTKDDIYSADAVIITVPLGVLKNHKIRFDPPLSEPKQNAIARLGMGLFNITAIKFPRSFWPKEPHAMLFTQFVAPSVSTFFNLHHFIKEPVLIGYSGGETARRLETFSDEVIIERIMNNFKSIYGTNLPAPSDYMNTRWSLDPFAYGSYSYCRTGSSPLDYDTLAQSESNRIFFAGEATSSAFPATTHGAFLSGLREAEKIKKGN